MRDDHSGRRSPIRLVPLAAAFAALAWSPPGAAGGDNPPANEEAAIRAVDEAFVREFNRGDAKAVAALHTADAEAIEADGARYQGRDLIERSYAETFANEKGVKLKIEVASIQFLSPTVAKEEGRTIVTPTNGSPISRFYTVLFVKQGDRWLMANVREEADTHVPPRERLKELEWMVGEWVDNAPDSQTKLTCRMSDDGNFLLRDLTVRREGKVMLTATQRVAWDPVGNEFRSWEFDSEGGFGEATWSRDGEKWIVKERGVRPEGATASSTRILTRVRPDMVKWTLLDRVVSGQSIAGEISSVLTRVAPAPSLGGQPATTTPTSERGDR
ncbi:YybH family protein [Aquisphaera insulae]|uniref:YybH family protein n=1 Tax=Aquisphaera insulae TaxID=2712864 RepID=UPI0013EA9E68|nr:SgcJ/EcaC family oxidoreductase [Aquisphaera insulae]